MYIGIIVIHIHIRHISGLDVQCVWRKTLQINRVNPSNSLVTGTLVWPGIYGHIKMWHNFDESREIRTSGPV